jgi:integrase
MIEPIQVRGVPLRLTKAEKKRGAECGSEIARHCSTAAGFKRLALDHGDPSGVPANPCRDAGRPAKPKARERVLSERETGLLWHILEREGAPFGPAMQLLLLTGQRRNEVFSADRREFDVEAGLWTIPAERAKNGAAHLVPIPPAVTAIVKNLMKKGKGDKLFPARGNLNAGPSGFSKAMIRVRTALDEQMGDEVPHWTLHDLRRTLATGLQRLGVRLEVTEGVLNHLSGSRAGIVGVYQRHNYFDEKKAALVAWHREVKRLSRVHKLRMEGECTRLVA